MHLEDSPLSIVPQCSIKSAATDTQHFTDLRDHHVTLLVESLRGVQLVGGEERGAASRTATGTGRCQTGIGSFADEVSFRLCQGGKNVEHEWTTGRTGADILLKRLELDPLLLRRVHVVNQMTGGASETVQPPDHESVTLADLIQKLMKLGTGLECAGCGVGKVSIAASFRQCIELELCALAASRGFGISDEVSYCVQMYQYSCSGHCFDA